MHSYVYADEAGDFTFRREPNVSKYFILCTITAPNLDVCRALQELRHELIFANTSDIGDCFHATVDKQHVRDAVYDCLSSHDFSIQATICEKAKAQPQVRRSKSRFYKYPFYYHFKYGMSPSIKSARRVLVTTASIGQKKERLTFRNALNDVMNQNLRPGTWRVDFRPALADEGLQAADYCAWAIQRKWERNDDRAYRIIESKIKYEYELWSRGTEYYY